MTALLQLDQVSFTYDNQPQPVVTDISLTFQPGDFVSLIGPSGSGKSTLLKLMAGYHQPTIGRVLKRGTAVLGPGDDRAVIFQAATLYPWLTVAENIGFGLALQGWSQEQRAPVVTQLLAQIEMPGFENYKVFELSGGMKQRVALARTLAIQPEMILMDEPFASLDAFTKAKMQDLTRRIWQSQAATIFLITHDLDEALLLSTKIIVLGGKPGRILAEIPVTIANDTRENRLDFQTSPEYLTLKRQLLSYLIEEAT